MPAALPAAPPLPAPEPAVPVPPLPKASPASSLQPKTSAEVEPNAQAKKTLRSKRRDCSIAANMTEPPGNCDTSFEPIASVSKRHKSLSPNDPAYRVTAA
jgi:hypothetical protein